MESLVELSTSLPGLRAVRGTTTSLHTGVKDQHGIGRIEGGETEWSGSSGRGKVWLSGPGCILVKQPGDVVRHLSHRGPTAFTVVMLPACEVTRVQNKGRMPVIPQLSPGDERSLPFHRLLNAVLAEANRFSLEVALAEAINALALIDGAPPGHSRPVQRALDCLRQRMDDPITLDDLADDADFDKFHLCRAFRAQIGMPPHAYLTHLRVARAKELLGRGVRASDLAPMVGFYDQAQLTRHFRRLVGTTPARYGKSPHHSGCRGIFTRQTPEPVF